MLVNFDKISDFVWLAKSLQYMSSKFIQDGYEVPNNINDLYNKLCKEIEYYEED